ncbi:MAG: phage tail tape measure protein [Cucumibacter sp.]
MAENSIFGEQFESELSDVSVELDRIRDLANATGSAITTAFRRAIIDGKSLNSVLADVARRFADIALKAALKPVGLLISGFVERLFTAANPALGVTPFARGGVVNRPSYFPASFGRVGLMGEAGPEAIMPLARGADGRLGVAGGAASISISMTVNASDAPSFLRAEAEVSAMLLRAVRRGSRAS